MNIEKDNHMSKMLELEKGYKEICDKVLNIY